MTLRTILNIIKTSQKYTSFLHFIYKKKQSRVQKWICYQSLHVQQEPLTDRILKKINTGCLDLYDLKNNLKHNKNIPKNTHPFCTSFTQKIKSGSKMDLLSISKCPARAFNRSKYCRKSSKNVWIYMSLTTILNIIKISLK